MRKGVEAAKTSGKPEIGVDDIGAGDFSNSHVRAEPIVSELLQDPSALQSFERSVRERESALRTELSAQGIEVRTDDQSAHQRARVSITDRGDIILSIRSDLARNTFAEAKGNKDFAASITRELLHEERLHVATLSVWRDDWSGVGRRGSYRDYVRNRSVSLLGNMRSAVDKLPPADRAKSLEALHTAWASYFDPEGKRTDVTPANILEKITDLVEVDKIAQSPGAFVLELTRQLLQVKRSGVTSETVFDRMVAPLLDLGRRILEHLKTGLGYAESGAWGGNLRDLIARTEEAMQGEGTTFRPQGRKGQSDSFNSTANEPIPSGGHPPEPLPEPTAEVSPETNVRPLIRGSALDQWADKVPANSRGNLNSGLDPTVLNAYSVKGAALIESGLRTFADWSQQMLKEFGESIRPHLNDLWERTNEHLKVPPAIGKPDGTTGASAPVDDSTPSQGAGIAKNTSGPPLETLEHSASSSDPVTGGALNDIPNMEPWHDNAEGQTRSLPEAVAIFSQHIKAIDPTFDMTILNHVRFSDVDPATLTDKNGLHAWAQYGPFMEGSGPKGEYTWKDILGRNKYVLIPVDRRVFASDEAILGIIAHELHELNAIRAKIEASPNKSISALDLKS